MNNNSLFLSLKLITVNINTAGLFINRVWADNHLHSILFASRPSTAVSTLFLQI